MIDTTILGDINIDIITSPIDRYPPKDRQIITPKIHLNLGGCAAITAVACSNMGIRTRLIGKLGNDVFSNYLLDILNNFNVDTKIERVDDGKAGITIAINFKDTSRSFITYKGTNATLSLKDIKVRDIQGKIFVVTGFNLLNELRKDVVKLFRTAKDKEMITALDPNWDPEGWTRKRLKDIENVLKVCDWFFPDEKEGRSITGMKNDKKVVKELLSMGPKVVCLKMGKEGCLLGYSNIVKHIKSFNVNSVNTTGAGDVFLAGFIKGYLSEWLSEDAARFANAAGALSTTKYGLERYPSYDDVIKFIKRRKD